MISFTTLKCSICKSKIKNKATIEPDINPLKDLKIKKKNWSNLEKAVKKRIFFPYHRCSCGLLTNKYFLDHKSLKYLYSNMKENIHSNDDETNDLRTKNEYLKQIKNIIKGKNDDFSILEIGADNGSFQKLIRSYNSKIKTSVVEPNKKMFKKLKSLSNNVYSDIKILPKNKKFDLIIAIHVLDHIPNFLDFLKVLKSKLKKKGLIYGVVHNERSMMARILGNRWPAYCLQHPQLFNKSSIDKAFKKLNYNKKFIKKTINFFNLGFLLHHLFIIIFNKRINFPSFFPIGLKLGNFSFLYKK